MQCLKHSLRNYVLPILLVVLSLSVALLYYSSALITSLAGALSQSSPTTLSEQKIVITKKIINITNAMADFEGWHPGGISGGQAGVQSVAYRNHNPGNLRYSIFQLGKRDGFAFFYNDETGIFAMRFDIMRKCQGKTVTKLNGESTLADLIEVYSAEKGETLQNYIDFVVEKTGFGPRTKLKTFVQ